MEVYNVLTKYVCVILFLVCDVLSKYHAQRQ